MCGDWSHMDGGRNSNFKYVSGFFYLVNIGALPCADLLLIPHLRSAYHTNPELNHLNHF